MPEPKFLFIRKKPVKEGTPAPKKSRRKKAEPAKQLEKPKVLYFQGYCAVPTTVAGIAIGSPKVLWTDDRWLAADFKRRDVAEKMLEFLAMLDEQAEIELERL